RQRSHNCGQLRAADAGQTVTLMGWVNRRRDHGSLIFLDVRDRYGITQAVLDKDLAPEGHAKAESARPEYVVCAIGKVRLRGPESVNPKMLTGEIEIAATELLILNDAKLAPFSPAEEAIANEEVRLKYRYLDLRRPEMQRNFEIRHKVALAVREYLNAQNFFEIETPFMTRSTPEGARDYLVPSRVHPGHFYALPQSPQLFKQILMISGLDRYFQIARCFRDEDLRADRQPEFTQIDLEMTFPQQEDIFRVVEGFLKASYEVIGEQIATPFPRMTYDDAIRSYGIDKPDLRLPPMTDVRDQFTTEELASLKIEPRLPIIAIVIPNRSAMSNTQKKAFAGEMNAAAAPDLAYLDVERLAGSPLYAALAQRIDAAAAMHCGLERVEPEHRLVVLSPRVGITAPAKDHLWLYKKAGQLRLDLAKRFEADHKAFEKKGNADDYKFLWVTDFPFFEWDEAGRTWTFAHHPFTSPHEDDLVAGRMTSDPEAVRALAYDIVLNGMELGSGSIRIHRQDVQQQIFRALGMSDEEAKERFGFFLEALQYGTPPHGGIALGLDRLVMILAGAQSLREVIAFPKTAKAIDLMVDAPTPVSDQQLKELHIRPVLKG
ncbi:MAG TPA: aspartate--tRNA ligase, partial [Acidobacteriaceae bacterium]|nr:aspartate--tRNA ligase [Acidobacteriaceae bacterium]